MRSSSHIICSKNELVSSVANPHYILTQTNRNNEFLFAHCVLKLTDLYLLRYYSIIWEVLKMLLIRYLVSLSCGMELGQRDDGCILLYVVCGLLYAITQSETRDYWKTLDRILGLRVVVDLLQIFSQHRRMRG
jgi:hypothetical protein